MCSLLQQVITSVKGMGQIMNNSNVLKTAVRSTIRAFTGFFQCAWHFWTKMTRLTNFLIRMQVAELMFQNLKSFN